MPQPKPANGGGDFDVLVRGVVGTDGKVHDAAVQSSERSDLNADAVSVIEQSSVYRRFGICRRRN